MRWTTRSAWGRRLLVRLIPLWVGFVFRTNRLVAPLPDAVQDLIDRRQPVIWCFWHGRMLLMPGMRPPTQRVHVLISHHRDGRLIAEAVNRMKLHTVTGSSSRGARGATLALMRLLRAGDSICITPDGPRGPRMRARPGAVALAAMSGAPVVPVSYSTTRARFNRSWDRFLIPWPFGRMEVKVGEPILLPRDADSVVLAAARRRLEDELNRLTAAADRACGHQPIEPDAQLDEPDLQHGELDGQPDDAARRASLA
ncbi:MAG: lysophospholipid acyltransferase family protein [Alphaproteobacteria bacterium]